MKAITDTEAATLRDRHRFALTSSRGECDG